MTGLRAGAGWLTAAAMVLAIGFAAGGADVGRRGPAIVMIIRHAEKPDKAGDPDLSAVGFQRADALAKVFPARFPHPDFLIATKPSKDSRRPLETITPLARALHETIDADLKDDEVGKLAQAVLNDPRYEGKVVLIAWHHEEIPELARDLGAKAAPEKWNARVFDRVWEISYDKGTASFKDLPEEALPGDSTK